MKKDFSAINDAVNDVQLKCKVNISMRLKSRRKRENKFLILIIVIGNYRRRCDYLWTRLWSLQLTLIFNYNFESLSRES